MDDGPFRKFLAFVERCDRTNLPYDQRYIRPDTVMVLAHVPGQYWEIEFFDDGRVKIERYYAPGGLDDDESLLDDLLTAWDDDPEAIGRIYPARAHG